MIKDIEMINKIIKWLFSPEAIIYFLENWQILFLVSCFFDNFRKIYIKFLQDCFAPIILEMLQENLKKEISANNKMTLFLMQAYLERTGSTLLKKKIIKRSDWYYLLFKNGYTAYKEAGGNSFIDELNERIQERVLQGIENEN